LTFPSWFACVIVKKLTILLFNKKTILRQWVCESTWGYFLIPFMTENLELTSYYQPKCRYLLDDAWIYAIGDRKKKQKVSYGPSWEIIFCKQQNRAKGSKKLSWITILAWHDMHKIKAPSLGFQSICTDCLKIVLSELQICIKTIWFLLESFY